MRPAQAAPQSCAGQVLSYTSLKHPRKLRTTIFNFPSLMFPIPKREMSRPMGIPPDVPLLRHDGLFTEQLQMDLKHARKMTKHDEDATG
jgi:hypothetical protein